MITEFIENKIDKIIQGQIERLRDKSLLFGKAILNVAKSKVVKQLFAEVMVEFEKLKTEENEDEQKKN